ncbi:MAG TPA: hypothetical protein VIL68_04235 [Propionibacteriaceae bacterium]|jgi:hypothetical protein
MKTSLKVGVAAAVLAVAGLIAVPMAMAQTAPGSVPAATPTTNPSTSTCTTAQHLASVYKALPAQLRTDLEAAKKLPAGAQRDAALKAVLDKAAGGAYGEKAQKVATRIEKRGGKLWGKLPAALKTDLTAIVNADPGQPTLDAAAGVFDKATSGAYGDIAKKVATKIAGTKAWTSCKVR